MARRNLAIACRTSASRVRQSHASADSSCDGVWGLGIERPSLRFAFVSRLRLLSSPWVWLVRGCRGRGGGVAAPPPVPLTCSTRPQLFSACGLPGAMCSEAAYFCDARCRHAPASDGADGLSARARSDSATPQLYSAWWLSGRRDSAASYRSQACRRKAICSGDAAGSRPDSSWGTRGGRRGGCDGPGLVSTAAPRPSRHPTQRLQEAQRGCQRKRVAPQRARAGQAAARRASRSCAAAVGQRRSSGGAASGARLQHEPEVVQRVVVLGRLGQRRGVLPRRERELSHVEVRLLRQRLQRRLGGGAGRRRGRGGVFLAGAAGSLPGLGRGSRHPALGCQGVSGGRRRTGRRQEDQLQKVGRGRARPAPAPCRRC